MDELVSPSDRQNDDSAENDRDDGDDDGDDKVDVLVTMVKYCLQKDNNAIWAKLNRNMTTMMMILMTITTSTN